MSLCSVCANDHVDSLCLALLDSDNDCICPCDSGYVRNLQGMSYERVVEVESMRRGFTKQGKERRRCQCQTCGQFACSQGNGFDPSCDHFDKGVDYSGNSYLRFYVWPCRECYEAYLDERFAY